MSLGYEGETPKPLPSLATGCTVEQVKRFKFVCQGMFHPKGEKLCDPDGCDYWDFFKDSKLGYCGIRREFYLKQKAASREEEQSHA